MRAVCGLLVGITFVLCVPTCASAQAGAAPRRGRSGFDTPAPSLGGAGVKWDRIQINYIDVRQLTAFLGAPNFPSEADLYWSGLQGGMVGFGMPGMGMPGMMGGGIPGMMGMPGMMGRSGMAGGSYAAGAGMMPGGAVLPGAAGAAAGTPGSAWFPGTYLLGDPRTNGLIVGRPGP